MKVVNKGMKLHYMAEFVTLAEKLNYTRSASEHYIAQSILSRHIRAIEEELGVCLFVRSTHGVELTDEGRFVHEVFGKIVRQYDELLSVLTSRANGLEGNLRLGILYYAIEEYTDSLIAPFQKKYPNIDLSILSYQPPSLIQDLLDRKIDVGLAMRVTFPETQNLKVIDIRTEPLLLMLPASHRLFGRSEVSVRELIDETFVFIKGESWHEPYITKLLFQQGFDKIQSIYTDQIDTLAGAVIEQNALAIMSGHVSSMGRKHIGWAAIAEKTFCIVVSLACLADNNNPSVMMFLNAGSAPRAG